MHNVVEGKTFSKILLAIEESRTSVTDKVLDYATKVAQDYDAQLIVLHVIRSNANLTRTNIPSYVIEMKRRVEEHFIEITQRIHERRDDKKTILRIKTEIIASVRIADAIISYAKDKHIDLIVIGTRGRSKLKSMLLGSVASDVVRYAHCPVLTIK
jgi:nucleotide-binding universal stress UspA family protein